MRSLVAWKVGGEQGTGVDSTGVILATVCSRLGYHIYGYREFSSRIKGGHSNFKIRIGVEPVSSVTWDLHALFAIDQETIDRNHGELVAGGLVVADEGFKPKLPEGSNARLLAMPLNKMAKDIGNPLVRNVIMLGVTAYLFDLPLEPFEQYLEEMFSRKGEEVVGQNKAALRRGFAFASEHILEREFRLAKSDGKPRLLMRGNDAAALGALVAGCRFMSAYPITPASDVMEWLQTRLPEHGGVVVQAEDEISALMMAIGAGFGGVRSMTATSGPGISLMQEAIGLAHVAEVPVVIIDCQRGGPSTGMPTKHEQSDVFAVLHGSHGDTTRIVLAPSNPEEVFYDTAEAFNLAERYQCPVFVMLDFALALDVQTVDGLDLSKVKIDRGLIATPEDIATADEHGFKRYRITESGISPRSLPGMPKGQYLATGVEHDEYGKVSEDPKNRKAMMDKRFRKVESVDLPGVVAEGPVESELLLIGFGSTAGPLREARKELLDRGAEVTHLHVRMLAPFPVEEMAPYLQGAKRILVVENNATGQLAQLIRSQCADALQRRKAKGLLGPIESLLRYDGRPMLSKDIVEEAEEVRKHVHAG